MGEEGSVDLAAPGECVGTGGTPLVAVELGPGTTPGAAVHLTPIEVVTPLDVVAVAAPKAD